LTGVQNRVLNAGGLQAAETSSSVECLVLTQDDVRQGRKQSRQTTVDDMSVRPGRAVALSRSATIVTPSDTRHKSLLPIFTATDTATASTWLDDGHEQSDDRLEARSTGTKQAVADAQTQPARLHDTTRQHDGYDFHFGLSSSQPQQQQQQPPAAALSSSNGRPVALVQPHKVTGVRVMPASWSQGKPGKPAPTSGQLQAGAADAALQQHVSRLKNKEERQATAATSLRDQLKAASSRDMTPTPLITKPCDFNCTTTRSSSTEAVAGATSDTGAQLTSKDKEIASAIGSMKLDYDSSQNTLSPHGTNFEKCLGYFP